jgi:hypothetical protein
MTEALAAVLPLALGIAASPVPIVPVVLLLLTERPRAAGGAFLSGWALGILATVLAFSALAALVEQGSTPTWASWLRILLGTGLVVVGVRTWLGRHASTEALGWMQGLGEADPPAAFRLGLVLSAANPKVVVLAAAAGLAAGGLPLGPGELVVVSMTFTAVASVSVATPVVLHLVLGPRVEAPLGATRDWLLLNSSAVVAVVLLVLGILLVVKGIGELSPG